MGPMNSAVARYKRALKRKLPCGSDMRKILLNRFQSMLDSFLEEHPAPAEEDLRTAFGTPEAMAEVLSEGLSEEETKRYQNRKLLQKICAGALAIVLVVFSVYVLFLKETPLNVIDKAVIYPEESITTVPIP